MERGITFTNPSKPKRTTKPDRFNPGTPQQQMQHRLLLRFTDRTQRRRSRPTLEQTSHSGQSLPSSAPQKMANFWRGISLPNRFPNRSPQSTWDTRIRNPQLPP
ncbi:hypothetical protein ACFX2I_011711 [Malus domestica]